MADGGAEQAVEGILQPFGTVGCFEKQGKGAGFEARFIELAQFVQIVVGQDRVIKADHPGAGRRRLEQV